MEELTAYLFRLTGGNPGALRVCCEVIKDGEDSPGESALVLRMIESLNLTGAQIWMLYKDECGEDIRRFGRRVIEKCADAAMSKNDSRKGEQSP